MKQNIRDQKGFTLVEVIVVAVIVATLASAAVPIYLNYVDGATVHQANNIASSFAQFCHACRIEGGTYQIESQPQMNTSGKASCTVNESSIVLPQSYSLCITTQGVMIHSMKDFDIHSRRIPIN